MKKTVASLSLGSGFMALTSKSALACAVCMGASDAPIAPAINASIFLLLGVIAAVGGTFFYFLLYLARRYGLPLPPEHELSRSIQNCATQQS